MEDKLRLPKHHETYNIILKTLSANGKMNHTALKKHIRDEHYKKELDADLLKQTSGKSKQQTILIRIHFGIMDLVVAKILHRPEVGMIEMTDKGKRILKSGNQLTYSDLKQDQDFIDVMAAAKLKRELKNNDDKSMESDNSSSASDDTPTERIASVYQDIKMGVQDELLDTLKNINPYELEKIVLELFRKMGYGVPETTPKSHDGGIDGIIHQDSLGLEKIYCQVKRYTDNKINAKEMNEFIGLIVGKKGNKGIFVTTSDFNDNALKSVQDSPHRIELINGDRLVELMYEYGCGVEIEDSYHIKKLDGDFFDEYS